MCNSQEPVNEGQELFDASAPSKTGSTDHASLQQHAQNSNLIE